jgi:hypothetical protein
MSMNTKLLLVLSPVPVPVSVSVSVAVPCAGQRVDVPTAVAKAAIRPASGPAARTQAK